MQTFWSHGFEATSMQDLVDATGVNRASLYATYGDKRELFLASLRKYGGEVRGRMLADLAQADTAAQAIAGLFDKFRSEEHTSELQSLMRISYAVFCLKKKKQ